MLNLILKYNNQNLFDKVNYMKNFIVGRVILMFMATCILFPNIVTAENYRNLCNDRVGLFSALRNKLIDGNKIIKWEGHKMISNDLFNKEVNKYIIGKINYLERYSDIKISIEAQKVAHFFIFPANDLRNFLTHNSEFVKLFLPDQDVARRIEEIKDDEISYSVVGINHDMIISGLLVIENNAKFDPLIKSIDGFMNAMLGLNNRIIFNSDDANYGFAWTDLMFLKLIYSSNLLPEDLLIGSDRAYEAARNSRFCK
jgi:hypothetical protein